MVDMTVRDQHPRCSGRRGGEPCPQRLLGSTCSGIDDEVATQQAQDVRMSKRAADNQFWDRYKTFAATAERYCAR